MTVDGKVFSWGDKYSGGNSDSVRRLLGKKKVKEVLKSKKGFCAVTTDDEPIVWGQFDPPNGFDTRFGVTTVTNGYGSAGVMIQKDGSITTWGSAVFGGDNSSVQQELKDCKIDSVYSTNGMYTGGAFCVLTTDGQVFSWGCHRSATKQATLDGSDFGGDSSSVRKNVRNRKVDSVYSTSGKTGGAFCVLTTDGQVFAWGDQYYGGDCTEVRKTVERF